MSSLSSKLQEVFEEPACGKNQGKSDKERKKGCTKQLSPGAAAGGCAFDGAKIALQPITDVAHLVHGPIACEGNSWDNRHALSSGAATYRTGFTTDISELDVVYGGEKRLYKAVKEIIDKYDPPAVFVYQTCVTALIGDDIEAVCKAASQKFNKPVIPVNSPGFAGVKNLGNKLGGEALLDYVIGTQEPEYTTPYDINIIGEYNSVGGIVAGQTAARRHGRARPRVHQRRCQVSGSRVFTPRQGIDDGVLQGDDQYRPKNAGAISNPVLRGILLRHRRHVREPARDRPPTGAARSTGRHSARAPRR